MVANALLGAALAAVVLGIAGEGKALKKSLKQRALWRVVWRGMRFRHLWPAPFVLGVAALLGYVLHTHVGGLLDWGWWSAIGGHGNVVLGKNEQLFGAAGSLWIGRTMLLVIAVLMPNLVTFEERLFRRGIERKTPWRRAGIAVGFGLFHLIAGLPIWATLALSVLGFYCSHVYMRTYRAVLPLKGDALARRHAVLESTRAHVGFNALGVLVAAVTLVG